MTKEFSAYHGRVTVMVDASGIHCFLYPDTEAEHVECQDLLLRFSGGGDISPDVAQSYDPMITTYTVTRNNHSLTVSHLGTTSHNTGVTS